MRREGVDGWLKALIFSNAAIAIPAAILIARTCTLRLRWRLIRDALVYAGPMIPSFFCNWLSNSVDRLFVGRWAGMSSNALYGAASQLGNILQIAFLPVFMTYMPIFYRLSGGGEGERRTAEACNRILILLISIAGCILIGVAPLLAGTVLPRSYAGVSGTFAWLVVAGCFAQFAGVATLGLYHCRRTDLVFYMSALQALVSIVMDLALIPWMGREGAVLAQLASNAALAAGLFLLAWRTYGKLIEPQFIYRNMAIVIVMGFLASVPAHGALLAVSLSLQAGVLIFCGLQLWAEKQSALEVLSKNLWQVPAPEPLPVN